MLSPNTDMYEYWYGQYEWDDTDIVDMTETLHCHYQLSASKWNLLLSTFLLHKASHKDDQNL